MCRDACGEKCRVWDRSQMAIDWEDWEISTNELSCNQVDLEVDLAKVQKSLGGRTGGALVGNRLLVSQRSRRSK